MKSCILIGQLWVLFYVVVVLGALSTKRWVIYDRVHAFWHLMNMPWLLQYMYMYIQTAGLLKAFNQIRVPLVFGHAGKWDSSSRFAKYESGGGGGVPRV